MIGQRVRLLGHLDLNRCQAFIVSYKSTINLRSRYTNTKRGSSTPFNHERTVDIIGLE